MTSHVVRVWHRPRPRLHPPPLRMRLASLRDVPRRNQDVIRMTRHGTRRLRSGLPGMSRRRPSCLRDVLTSILRSPIDTPDESIDNALDGGDASGFTSTVHLANRSMAHRTRSALHGVWRCAASHHAQLIRFGSTVAPLARRRRLCLRCAAELLRLVVVLGHVSCAVLALT